MIQKQIPSIPDDKFYINNVFQPWSGYGEFEDFYKAGLDLAVNPRDRCHILYQMLLQSRHVCGDFFECGVYKGGTALMFAWLMQKMLDDHPDRRLHLFDTFEGMPEVNEEKDNYAKKGMIKDTNIDDVKKRFENYKNVEFYKGLIPKTFENLNVSNIAFAHLDLDLYQSTKDSLEYIYPKMPPGGVIVFDDYGLSFFKGVLSAVDEFFYDKKEIPLILPTSQAVVFKL